MNINNYLTEQNEILTELLENFNGTILNENSDSSDIIISANMFLLETGNTAETLRMAANEKIAAITKNASLTKADKTRETKKIEATLNRQLQKLESIAKKVKQTAKKKVPATKKVKKVKKVKGTAKAGKGFFNYIRKMKPTSKAALVGVPLVAGGAYLGKRALDSRNSQAANTEDEHFEFGNLLRYDD